MASVLKHMFVYFLYLNLQLCKSSIPNYSQDDARIIGGTEANPAQFPYQLSVRRRWDGRHICGATFVQTRNNATLIIGAAHCFHNKTHWYPPGRFLIMGGSIYKDAPDAQVYSVGGIATHREYNTTTMLNDIAVIYLAGGQKLLRGHTVVPAHLPNLFEEFPGELVATGWGATENPENSTERPNRLRHAMLPVVDTRQCAWIYRNTTLKVTRSKICAGNDKRIICNGDSGGPLIKFKGKGEQQTPYFVGIAGWGPKGCVKPGYSYPAVFTKVSYYIDWIHAAASLAKYYTKESSVITSF